MDKNRKWNAKNKINGLYYSQKETAESFVNNKATYSDLKKLLNLITKRKIYLDNQDD